EATRRAADPGQGGVENSKAGAHDRLRRELISKPDTRRKVVAVRVPLPARPSPNADERERPFEIQSRRLQGRSELRVEVGELVEAFRARRLILVAQAEVEC